MSLARGPSAVVRSPALPPPLPPAASSGALASSATPASAGAPAASVAPPPALTSEHALEVVAMLGDSVVALKHCSVQARRGLGSPWTWALVAALAAATSLLAFGWSVRVAAHNEHAQQAWLALGRPLWGFRPQLLGPGYDVAAFGGLALAMIASTLWLVQRRRRAAHPRFRIGTARGVELPVANVADSFEVVSAPRGELVVRYTSAFQGELVHEHGMLELAELAAHGWARPGAAGSLELRMPVRGRLRLRLGEVTLRIVAVPRPARALAVLVPRLEQRVFGYAAASTAAHLAVWALLRALPVEATIGELNFDQSEQARARVVGTAQQDPLTSSEPEVGVDGPTGGEAMAFEAGTAGTPDSTPTQLRHAIARTADTEQLARQQAIEEAVRSGIMSTGLSVASFRDLTGSADLSSGLDATFAHGNLYGTAVGSTFGSFGVDVRGGGPGGGGAEGTSRTGGYRTGGHVPGGYTIGSCGSAGPCTHGLSDRHAVVPKVTISAPTVCGGAAGCGFDKAIIRRYVNRAKEKIRYCYEKQLLSKAEIEGTVQATFLIAPSGTVMKSSASGVDPEVSQCVADVISAIAFPRSGTTGAVQVNYPFLFRRS